MEQSDRVAVVAPARAEWNDVGFWFAIADLREELEDAASVSDDQVIAID